jgi:hypothetical protein
MKPQTEMIEGTEAFTRFQNTMRKVLAVPHAELKRRIEAERQASKLNPHRRGPKPKTKPASAPGEVSR